MEDAELEDVLRVVRERGIVRPRELRELGVGKDCLLRLHKKGLLERIGRGLYAVPDADLTERHSLAVVCKRVPGAVVSLLSALNFHNLTTQLPHAVWITIPAKARRPKLDCVQLEVTWCSGRVFTLGVETRAIEGVGVRVYNPAKTVVDCFKFRNKVGLDVALEALRDCLRQRKATVDEIWRCAKVCRMANVMRPYMEAVTI